MGNYIGSSTFSVFILTSEVKFEVIEALMYSHIGLSILPSQGIIYGPLFNFMHSINSIIQLQINFLSVQLLHLEGSSFQTSYLTYSLVT